MSCSKKNNDQPSNTVTINGTDYKTVTIGSQTWTAVNYNGSGGTNYNNSSTNNPTYGKLYTLAEAKAIALPKGWRLPTKGDIEKLLTGLGATGTSDVGVDGGGTVAIKLKSKSDWTPKQGNNSSGFNAYPAGDVNNTTYEYINSLTMFWSSNVDTYNDPYVLEINNLPTGPTVNVNDDGDAGLDYVPAAVAGTFRVSLRFVKDN